jgi:phosphoserine phosphatase
MSDFNQRYRGCARRDDLLVSGLHRDALLRLVQSVTLAPGAREGIAAPKRAGARVALVSITWQFAVDWVASELGADFAVGTQWREDDSIEHFWSEDKVKWLARCGAGLGLQPCSSGQSVSAAPQQ